MPNKALSIILTGFYLFLDRINNIYKIFFWTGLTRFTRFFLDWINKIYKIFFGQD